MVWACVIGKPIEHSLSPVLHRKAYELLGLDWEYRKYSVDQEELETFLTELPQDCVGVSVTMPNKRAVLRYVDSVESVAKALRVANTIVIQSGFKAAFNTDVWGIQSALSLVPSGKTEAGRPLILGNGATACSAVAALASLGYRDIVIAARNLSGFDGAFALAPRLGVNAEGIPLKLLDRSVEVANTAPIMVSTIPHDASFQLSELISPAQSSTLLDVTYSGSGSPLEQSFVRVGASVVSPLTMLVHQGIAQVKLMTNREVPFEPVYEAVVRAANRG